MKRPAAIGRDLIAVPAALPRRRYALDRAAAVEAYSIQKAFDRRVRRRGEIRPAALRIDGVDVDHVALELRQQPIAGAVERDAIQMAPAVLLARPRDGA